MTKDQLIARRTGAQTAEVALDTNIPGKRVVDVKLPWGRTEVVEYTVLGGGHMTGCSMNRDQLIAWYGKEDVIDAGEGFWKSLMRLRHYNDDIAADGPKAGDDQG